MDTQPHSTAIRQLWFGYLNAIDRLEADKWYYRYHAPEFVRWFGPWLRRYETFNVIDPPHEAVERYGARPGKYTEMWWGSLDELKDSRSLLGNRPYTWGNWERGSGRTLTAMTVIPAHPTDIHHGTEINHELSIVRWMRVMKYPEGVSQQEGDQWYREVYARELRELSGLLWYVSYTTVDYGTPRSTTGAYSKWHRVDELWFTNLAAWKTAWVDTPLQLSGPPWARVQQDPFMEMYSDFVRVKSDVDFLRDLPLRHLS